MRDQFLVCNSVHNVYLKLVQFCRHPCTSWLLDFAAKKSVQIQLLAATTFILAIMSNIAQAIAVRCATIVLTTSTYILETLGLESIMSLRFSSPNVTSMATHSTQYFVRQDRKDKQKRIRIFNGQGKEVYVIERLSALNPVWSLLTVPKRQEIATINTSFGNMSVDFHNKSGITHRSISNEIGFSGGYRSFYAADGVKYSWSTGTKFLERIINPNGGVEEIRERVAKVKLMRQFKVDFEVLVDSSKIDDDIVLATGFVSMLTQWGIGETTDTVGPTYIPPLETVAEVAEENKVIVVIQNELGADIEVQQVAKI